MKYLLILFILFTTLIFSCKEKEAVTPIVIQGSLTAEIDSINRNYSINMVNTTIDTGISDGIKFIVIEGMDLGSNTLFFYIPSRDTGTYKLAQGIESTIRYISKQGVMYRGKSGTVRITKVDFINKKLSGTFNAKLLQTGSTDTIYLTNGVFTDLPLPKKQ